MPIDEKILAGVMDLDSAPQTVHAAMHRTARNITFRGIGNNKRVENIFGNRTHTNPLLPATGTNKTLGAWYDAIRRRIYFFNYNSDGAHGIYSFDTITKSFSRLVEVGFNTNGDVLQLTVNSVICNVNVIYGDALQGDQLYWLNSQGKPSKINIDRALSGGYGIIQEGFLDVASAPPPMPPSVVYEDDDTVTVNNLRKKLFKFKLRYVYDDNEKSVTSIQSEIPLPYDPFETSVDADATLNCRIAIVYPTGPANVKKVEICGAVSLGTEFSEFFLIKSVDKTVEGLADNDIAVFNFYNNEAYNNINLDESIQLFDYVPLQAVAQELLNGVVPIYGNITEGYDNLTVFDNGDGDTSNIQFLNEPGYSGLGRYFSLIVTSQSGDSGFGTGNIHCMVKGRVTEGNVYTITMTDLTTITYTAIAGDDIPDVLDGLIADALGKGYTVTGSSATPDELYFSQTGKVLAFSRVLPNGILENRENASDGSIMAYDWWSRYGFGLVYMDEKYRTNGAVYPASLFTGQTPAYADSGTASEIPYMFAAIWHRPPVWAKYFTWVRTQNLTKSYLLQWISDRTFKDQNEDANNNKYAYISLETLNIFNTQNPNSPLSYTFASNDRIRFIKRFNEDNSTANLYTDKDFEIQGEEINPTINGVVQNGHFIKIFLPATDVNFDFGEQLHPPVVAPINYNYYFFEIYTPAQPVANELDLYYEFGERYKIGDAGLSTRFHQGQTQNQTSDLQFPAVYNFIKGDNYLRYRTVQIGTEINYSIAATACMDSDAGQITLGATFVNQTLNDPNITPGNSPCNNLLDFNVATNTTRQILTIGTGTFSFRIVGAVSIVFADTLPGDTYEFYIQKNDLTKIQLVPVFDSSQAGTYNFTFDATFTMTSGQRLFIFGFSPGANDHTRTFNATTFKITRELSFTQTVIDPNFSDYYPSSVNSNGRGFPHDPNAAQITYQNMYRWGLAFQQSTLINQSNRFYEGNFDTVDLSKGGIMRFRVWEKIMRIYQERKVAQVGIYQRFVTQTDGTSALITSNEIITKDNAQYYLGEYGIGAQVASLVSTDYRDYFFDPIRNVNIRASLDGLEVISVLYRAQNHFGVQGAKYQAPHEYIFGGDAKVMGTFLFRKDLPPLYLCLFQGGTNEASTITGQIITFNEESKGYESFWDINADWVICAENDLYSFYGGELMVYDEFNPYAEFNGIQYTPSLKLLFNKDVWIKKVYNAVSYQSNAIWQSPVIGDVNTSMINPQTGLQQQSKLVAADYEIQEDIRYAAFLRDTNSMADPDIALWEGDWLNGVYCEVNFVYTGVNFAWVFAPYVLYQISQRNF